MTSSSVEFVVIITVLLLSCVSSSVLGQTQTCLFAPDFEGAAVGNAGSAPNAPWSVTYAGSGIVANTRYVLNGGATLPVSGPEATVTYPPIEGAKSLAMYSATTGSSTLAQTIRLGPEVGLLRWSHQLRNFFFPNGPCPMGPGVFIPGQQDFQVAVFDIGANTETVLYTASGGSEVVLQASPSSKSVSLVAFRGKLVELRFRMVGTRCFFNSFVDAISIDDECKNSCGLGSCNRNTGVCSLSTCPTTTIATVATTSTSTVATTSTSTVATTSTSTVATSVSTSAAATTTVAATVATTQPTATTAGVVTTATTVAAGPTTTAASFSSSSFSSSSSSSSSASGPGSSLTSAGVASSSPSGSTSASTQTTGFVNTASQPNANEDASSSAGSDSMIPVIAGAAGAVCCLLIIVAVVILMRRRSRNNTEPELQSVNLEPTSAHYAGFSTFDSSDASSGLLYARFSPESIHEVPSPDDAHYASLSAVNTMPQSGGRKMNAEEDLLLLDPSLIRHDRELGRGQYGFVLAGWYGTQPVAIKNILGDCDRAAIAEFYREATLHARLPQCENIVRILGLVRQLGNGNPAIVLEYCGGSALDAAVAQQRLTVPQFWKVGRHVATGMRVLALNHITHRDLAARNILMSSNDRSTWVAKVSDFGQSRLREEKEGSTKSNTGPLKWMSPESLQMSVYSEKSDVWMYGCLLVEAWTGDTPFPNEVAVQAASSVMLGQRTTDVPFDCPAAELIAQCHRFNPEERPTFNDIILQALPRV